MYAVYWTALLLFFFFQAEDGIRDLIVTWSSDVCSSDLRCACDSVPGQGRDRQRRSDRLLPHRRAQLAHMVRAQVFAGLQQRAQLRRFVDRMGQPDWLADRQRNSVKHKGGERQVATRV